MCDRELDNFASSSSLSLTSGAELSLSSNAELGDVESNPEASELRVVCMLNYLKSPQASTLARKRKIAANPPKGMKRCDSQRPKVCVSFRQSESLSKLTI